MWEYNKGLLLVCFADYFQKVSSIHRHNMRSVTKNKLSENSRLETTPEHQEFLQYCPYSTKGFCSQLETDIDNPKITYTEKCRTRLPDKKIDSNDDINSWKRCWYEK